MELYKKLFEAKKEIGKISKDSKNPFFKSSYLSLNGLIEAVETVLEKHSLLMLQPISNGAVSTIIYDIDGDGEVFVSSSIPLPNLTDPQKLGSAVTYYRRYTLQSLLGLQAEDDDGNKASKPLGADLPKPNIERLSARLKSCKDNEQLAATYKSFTKPEQIATKVLATQLKEKLTKTAA